MKIASKILYSINQGIKGIFYNKTMSLVSTVSVSASLIILGILLTIVLNINQFITYTSDEINKIQVYIQDYTNDDKRIELKSNIKKIDGVKIVEFKTKEESFKDLKKSWGEDAQLLDGVKNPFEDHFIVTIDNADNIKNISKKIESIDNNISDVKYHKDAIQNFLNLSNAIKKFGSILMIGLLLICLVIISNTIKSRVYSKKEEIQIIKYIGASNSFAIAPFIVEGFFIGLLGSLISIGVCISIYGYILDGLEDYINFMVSNTIVPFNSVTSILIIVLLIVGIGVGVLGSVLSVKRHLRV